MSCVLGVLAHLMCIKDSLFMRFEILIWHFYANCEFFKAMLEVESF